MERLSLLPYTWETPYVEAMDAAVRDTRDAIGLHRNIMLEMMDIDAIPPALLDFAAMRWGALAWPFEGFIDDDEELDTYKTTGSEVDIRSQ